jgi:hypothetical protein
MTVFPKKLMQDEEDVDGAVLEQLTGETPQQAWARKNAGALDQAFEKDSANVDKMRKAKRAAKGLSVSRPESPTGMSEFAELEAPRPREGAPEITSSVTKAAPEIIDSELADAQESSRMGRRSAGLAAAGRMIGRAGLTKSPGSDQRDEMAMAAAGQPLNDLMSRRKEKSRLGAEARDVEDQGIQRTTASQATEQHGVSMEKAGREREYNDGKSQVSSRRRSEVLGLYPRQISKIPPEEFAKLSAADVDVLMKELQADKLASASNRNSAAMDRAFAQQVKDAGKDTAKGLFGEFDELGKRFEGLSAGLTTGAVPKGEFGGGLQDKVLNAIPGGFGERGMSDKGLALAKAQSEMGDLLTRMRTGAVISPEEEAHYRKIMGGGVGQDPRSLAQGLSTVFTSLRAKQRALQSGYNYLQNEKGQTPLDVISGQGAPDFRKNPAGGGAPQPVIKNGKRYEKRADGWYEVD